MRFIAGFCEISKNNGLLIKTIELKSITDSVVGKYCEFLESKNYSANNSTL